MEITNDQEYQPQQWIDCAENNRREKCGALSTRPIDGVVDYGAALACATLALAHLAESLPNGQEIRSIAAMAALQGATRDMDNWLTRSIQASGKPAISREDRLRLAAPVAAVKPSPWFAALKNVLKGKNRAHEK